MISFNLLPLVSRTALVCLSLVTLGANTSPAEKASAGLAWQIRGTWQLEGTGRPIHIGDAIQPASLLRPADTTGDHSITILLPDGQHLLYECFTVADCARGFRVPSLVSKPDPFAVDMLARIRTVLAGGSYDLSGDRKNFEPQATSDEAVAVLDSHNHVRVEGRLTVLPKGSYTYDLHPLDHAQPPQFHIALEKNAPAIDLRIPAPGLYDISVSDASNSPRIDLFLAAIRPEQSAHFQAFHAANTTMQKWNEDYAGWPIDDFLRAYLESLMQSEKAVSVVEIR